MTKVQEEQQSALENLRHETDERSRSDVWVARGAAGGVVLFIVVIVFGLYLALSVHGIVGSTKVLLTDGHTASAVSAKKTEMLAGEIKQLIEDGKTAGAQQSKAAASASKEGLVILHQAEALIGSEISANHASGLQTRAVICSIAETLHDSAAVVVSYCSKGAS